MAWESEITAWQQKKDRIVRQVFETSAREVERSIVRGSSITGSPGQRVLSGELQRSWRAHRVGPLVVEITTPLPYAPLIERRDHAVAKTRTGWQRIVKHAARRHADD